jgi:hypothetical protein
MTVLAGAARERQPRQGVEIGGGRQQLENMPSREPKGASMVKVVYEVVEHDGGWAYKFNNVFSETFPSHEAAHAAAARAAAEQRVPGRTEVIQLEDGQGNWREETVRGSDRPSTEVVDKNKR